MQTAPKSFKGATFKVAPNRLNEQRTELWLAHLLRGSLIAYINESGEFIRPIPLDEYGCTLITISNNEQDVFVTNIFTSVMSKADVASGEIAGQTDTGMAKVQPRLAGVAEHLAGL